MGLLCLLDVFLYGFHHRITLNVLKQQLLSGHLALRHKPSWGLYMNDALYFVTTYMLQFTQYPLYAPVYVLSFICSSLRSILYMLQFT